MITNNWDLLIELRNEEKHIKWKQISNNKYQIMYNKMKLIKIEYMNNKYTSPQ